MSDNASVLPNDFGKPYVWLFNVNKETITIKDDYNKEININERITSFSYKYNEENDDLCTIKFHIGNVSQLNHWLFREDQQFKVQWGYILPGASVVKSAMRTIAVRDINTNYKSDGIEIELECTDLVSYLKNVRLNRASSSNNFEDWIKEIASGFYVPTITVEGKTTLLRTDEKAEHYKNLAGISNMHMQTEPDQVIKGKSKAISSEIEERLNQSSKGPLYLDGRDNVISIKSRNFNQAPYKYYTYSGNTGELIEFRSKSNIVTSKDDEAEEAILEPETKKVVTSKQGNATSYDDPEYESDLKERIAVGSFFSQLRAKFEEAVNNPLKQPVIDDVNFIDHQRYGGSTVGATNIDGTTRVAYKGPRWDTERIYTAKQLINSPHLDRERRLNILKNYILKKVEKKYESSAKMLGDPSLISSKIYKFLNLSKRDSGNWYAVSVSHDITPREAYMTTMELIKKPARIANLQQRREDFFDEDNSNMGNQIIGYTEEDKAILSEPSTPQSFRLNEIDINNRIKDQLVYEESFFTNDIPFNPKEDNKFQVPPKPNAKDV